MLAGDARGGLLFLDSRRRGTHTAQQSSTAAQHSTTQHEAAHAQQCTEQWCSGLVGAIDRWSLVAADWALRSVGSLSGLPVGCCGAKRRQQASFGGVRRGCIQGPHWPPCESRSRGLPRYRPPTVAADPPACHRLRGPAGHAGGCSRLCKSRVHLDRSSPDTWEHGIRPPLQHQPFQTSISCSYVHSIRMQSLTLAPRHLSRVLSRNIGRNKPMSRGRLSLAACPHNQLRMCTSPRQPGVLF